MLHLDDNSLSCGGDKTYKICTVLEIVRCRSILSYSPAQNLVIESLMLQKEGLDSNNIYNSINTTVLVKRFAFCDWQTAIVLDFIVHMEKGRQYTDCNSYIGASAKVIKILLQPHLGKNHILYIENWYGSPTLFEWLSDRGSGISFTVRTNSFLFLT